MKIIDVARKTGLHRNTVTLLYNESAQRVDFETIDRLCRLFDCEVSELFEFRAEESSKRGQESD